MSLEGWYRAYLHQIHGSEMGPGTGVAAVSVTLRAGAEVGLWLFHLTGVCDGDVSKGLGDAERGTRPLPACATHTGGVMGWVLPAPVTLGVVPACVSHNEGVMGVVHARINHTEGWPLKCQSRWGCFGGCISHAGGLREAGLGISVTLEVTGWSLTVPFTLGLGQRPVPVSARPMRMSQGGLWLCRSLRRCDGAVSGSVSHSGGMTGACLQLCHSQR